MTRETAGRVGDWVIAALMGLAVVTVVLPLMLMAGILMWHKVAVLLLTGVN
jgi:hypothetical protein